MLRWDGEGVKVSLRARVRERRTSSSSGALTRGGERAFSALGVLMAANAIEGEPT